MTALEPDPLALALLESTLHRLWHQHPRARIEMTLDERGEIEHITVTTPARQVVRYDQYGQELGK